METFSSYNKKRIGYNDVSQTVKVIEKIAASALHETNHGMEALHDYTQHLQTLLSRITELQNLTTYGTTFHTTSTIPSHTLLILVTGDKGLVGDIWKKLFSAVQQNTHDELLVLGAKGMHFFPEEGTRTRHHHFQQRLPTTDEILSLVTQLRTALDMQQYTHIEIAHLQPLSLVEQEVEVSQLFPIKSPQEVSQKNYNVFGYPIISTPLPQLYSLLSKKYLQGRLRQVILETAISEFSARTVAMEHAGSKTDEESISLSRRYSRDRRQRETQKQLERFASNHANV